MADDRSPAHGGPGPGGPDATAGTAIDTSVPHSARIWNYWLGGKDNYAVDRAAGDAYVKVYPGIVDVARAGWAFLGRAVRYLALEAGIRQFLDVGTGLPTADNTHQIAQRAAPESRIVYVDNDPLILAHARALLTSTAEGATDYIDADMRDPEAVLARAAALLDFDQPVALLLMSVMGISRTTTRHSRSCGACGPTCHREATWPYTTASPRCSRRSPRRSKATTTPARSPTSSAALTRSRGSSRASSSWSQAWRQSRKWRPEATGAGAGPDSPSLAAVARKP